MECKLRCVFALPPVQNNLGLPPSDTTIWIVPPSVIALLIIIKLFLAILAILGIVAILSLNSDTARIIIIIIILLILFWPDE